LRRGAAKSQNARSFLGIMCPPTWSISTDIGSGSKSLRIISDWARRQPSAVRGIVYFETQVRPRSWDEFGPAQRGLFERLRSPEGEEMVLQQNVFVETLLPLWIIRPLSDEEMAVYRRPFLISGEDRRPMLTFPREILIGGEPQHMLGVVEDYGHWIE